MRQSVQGAQRLVNHTGSHRDDEDTGKLMVEVTEIHGLVWVYTCACWGLNDYDGFLHDSGESSLSHCLVDITEKACKLRTAARRVRLCVVTDNQTYVLILKDFKLSPPLKLNTHKQHTHIHTHTHTHSHTHTHTHTHGRAHVMGKQDDDDLRLNVLGCRADILGTNYKQQ